MNLKTKIKKIINETIGRPQTARKLAEMELRLSYQDLVEQQGGDSDQLAQQAIENKDGILISLVEMLEISPMFSDLLDEDLMNLAETIFNIAADDFLSMDHNEKLGHIGV